MGLRYSCDAQGCSTNSIETRPSDVLPEPWQIARKGTFFPYIACSQEHALEITQQHQARVLATLNIGDLCTIYQSLDFPESRELGKYLGDNAALVINFGSRGYGHIEENPANLDFLSPSVQREELADMEPGLFSVVKEDYRRKFSPPRNKFESSLRSLPKNKATMDENGLKESFATLSTLSQGSYHDLSINDTLQVLDVTDRIRDQYIHEWNGAPASLLGLIGLIKKERQTLTENPRERIVRRRISDIEHGINIYIRSCRR